MATLPRMDQSLRLDQKLVMTPQLQLAIKLLQMPALDLQEFIDQELLENPFLQSDDGMGEEDYTPETTKHDDMDSMSALEQGQSLEEKDMSLDMGWDNMYDAAGPTSTGSAPSGDGDGSWENTATEEETLKQHLEAQLGVSTKETVIRFLGSFIIDAIDDAGYVRTDLEDAAKRLNVPYEKMQQALEMVQGFDPAGVGARSLGECLRLQLEARGSVTNTQKVVLDNLELMARREYGKLAKLAGVDIEALEAVCDVIVHLTPKPGLKYGASVGAAVVPDVVVNKGENGWQAELNAEAMPKVLVQGGLTHLVESAKGDEKNYMNERVGRAQWLVKSLEQRARTIYKVAGAIVKAQEDFFNHGAEYLQPMTLKTIAEQVEAHESTISRVTNGKYMQTPMGVFELKYFFSSAIQTTGGNTTVASESVKMMIKRLIGEENPKKPLSDEKLVTTLKGEGVDVARRTVAKYREALGIPSSSGRRVRV